MGQSFTKLYSFVFAKKETCIVMAGLGGAGKTTILYKLKLGKVVATDPTIGYNIETLEYKNTSFIVWDFGAYFTGLQIQRQQLIWKHFFESIEGLIYVFDSTEHDRSLYAKNELHMMLNEDVMKDGALLVLANKQDLPNAMNIAEITDTLGLHSIQNRSWYIQSTCATSGEGLFEGLDWLSTKIANKD